MAGRFLVLSSLVCSASGVHVARAATADIAPAARLMRCVFAPEMSSTYSAYQAQRIYADGLSARMPRVWVARSADTADIVGTCECTELGDGPAALWHMSGLGVCPTARRQGVGLALVRAVQREASRARCPLFLHVEEANIPARALYASAGFELVADPLPARLHALRGRAARSVDPSAPAEVLYAYAATTAAYGAQPWQSKGFGSKRRDS